MEGYEEREAVERMAKGGGADTVKFFTTPIIGFFIHRAPHSKLGSEVAKYLVKAKQKSGRRMET